MQDRWRDPDFVAQAHAWIDGRLDELGLSRTGEVEQPHVVDWSTVMRVPTSAGDVWFKANEEALAFESALVEVVSAHAPDRVPPLLAREPDRGWMLMPDAGERLRDVVPRERSLARWLDVLDATARIQIACEDDVDDLLALGVPDRRLHTLPDAYAALLAALDDPDPRLPGPGEIAHLCACLARFGIRETLQHDDLHDGQVFVRDGTHLVLDWGDSCISHPFFTLSVTLEGVIAWGVDDEEGSEDLGPHLAAYLGPYREHCPHLDAGELEEAARLAMRLGWVCRAVNGHLPQDASRTHVRLRMFLDGRP